uniref:Retinol saturase, tandem duplicate 2 n=1 Tax=Callorhinchus milii TaxID=7868 RepID=A0A4W3HGQ7_CALMI
MDLTALGLCAALPLVAFLVYRRLFRVRSPNPFATDGGGFTLNKVPENLDAIVIGSGIGGLGAAAILAKAGKRVLVLEQHDQAGGCCHTFIEKGFEFDIGIHYIGELYERSFFRTLINQITNGQLQWAKIDEPFDTVVLGDLESRRSYALYGGEQQYRDSLKKHFPKEEEAIDKFLELVKAAYKRIPVMAMIKMIPLWLALFLIRTGIINWITSMFKLAVTPLNEVVNKLTSNQDLRAVMCYICGNYGGTPKDASFLMHALLIQHFKAGGWYPIGGASEIAFHIIPVIEKAGGCVLMRAPVERILVNQDGKACGVSVKKGETGVNLFAPVVISDAGIFNTYQRLLPLAIQKKPAIQAQLKMIEHGVGGFSVFVALNGSKEELGLKGLNYWFYQHNNLEELSERYLSPNKENAIDGYPLMFVSFPSAKDPSWDERFPGKSCLTIVTYARYDSFEEWTDERVKKRGHDYENLKMDIAKTLIDNVMEYFPQLKDRVEYFKAGSPLSHQFYIAASHGEMYGIHHGISRFAPETIASLRAQTPVENLYLTGQDIFCCGFVGAMQGAVLCASRILGRNLYVDVMKLKKQIKKSQSKKKA